MKKLLIPHKLEKDYELFKSDLRKILGEKVEIVYYDSEFKSFYTYDEIFVTNREKLRKMWFNENQDNEYDDFYPYKEFAAVIPEGIDIVWVPRKSSDDISYCEKLSELIDIPVMLTRFDFEEFEDGFEIVIKLVSYFKNGSEVSTLDQ